VYTGDVVFARQGWYIGLSGKGLPDEVLKLAENILKNTGYNEISLMSLSSAITHTYVRFQEICLMNVKIRGSR